MRLRPAAFGLAHQGSRHPVIGAQSFPTSQYWHFYKHKTIAERQLWSTHVQRQAAQPAVRLERHQANGPVTYRRPAPWRAVLGGLYVAGCH